MSWTDALLLGRTEGESGQPAGLYLPYPERATHLYVIGSTGVGKSKALASWAIHDLECGRGFGVIDPHGDLVADILSRATALSSIRLVEFGASETVTLNPLERIEGVDSFTQALELMDVFRKVWKLSESSAPRLLEVLRNSLITLIESGATVLELSPLLTDERYRARLVSPALPDEVLRFWRRFDRWSERERIAYVESTLNKAAAFTADPRLRRVLGAARSSIDFREVMDRRLALLVDLSKGVLSTNTMLIGALVLSRIQMAAVGRLTVDPAARVPWHLYVDEFQHYATDSFAEILSEARKMGLRLVLAHQSLVQLPSRLRSIVLGNAGSFVVFRTDRVDAELLGRYVTDVEPDAIRMTPSGRLGFDPLSHQWERAISELARLPFRHAMLRTKGRAARRFETLTYESDPKAAAKTRRLVRRVGLENGWLRPVADVNAEIAERTTALEGVSADVTEPRTFWESPHGSD